MKDGLNDLYIKDKMERNKTDFLGSGTGSGNYHKDTEFTQNVKASLIFVMLDAVFICLILAGVAMLNRDNRIKNTYQSVELQDVTRTSKTVSGKIDGLSYSFSGEFLFSDSQKHDAVIVYYLNDDYDTGVVLGSPLWYWFSIIMGTIGLGFSSWRIYKNMHITRHSAGTVSSGRFGD